MNHGRSTAVRIPIRKWEKKKVETVSHTYSRGFYPNDAPLRVRQPWAEDEEYCLEVAINGGILGVNVRIPAYLADKDPESFRRHIVNSLAHQIGSVVADEIRRTIV